MIAALKMLVLTLAAWTKREAITRAIRSDEPRPLAYEPDWFIGWAMLTYKGDMNPGAVRLYQAAWRERKHRQRIAEAGRLMAEQITKG
jgi:hypothetical protein